MRQSSDWNRLFGVVLLVPLWVLIPPFLCFDAYGQASESTENQQKEDADEEDSPKAGRGKGKTRSDRLPVFFTQRQAEEGRSAYREHCEICHGAKLEGIDHASGLVGTQFDRTWRGKSVEILSFHIRRMPPQAVAKTGSLGDETYTSILAYILHSNGVVPSETDLPSSPEDRRDLLIPQLDGSKNDPDAPVVLSAAQASLLENLPAVTNDVLNNPRPEDWLHWGGTYAVHNFSPLKEINQETVSGLKPAWRAPLRNGECNPAPLVHQGVMYLLTYPDTVLAMDATNGDVLWRYRHEGRFRSSNKMGLALHGNNVIVPTSDLHVLALEAKTGKVIWDHAIVHDQRGLELRSAPLVAGDKVLQGVMGIYVPKGGFIIAIDANTGEESWRFNTIPRPGEPGDNTWNDLPLEKRSGGSVWHQGSYDAELNLAYFGTAPTYDTRPLVEPIDKDVNGG